MAKGTKILTTVAVLLMTMLTMQGCGPQKTLIGSWKTERVKDNKRELMTFDFNENGTGTVRGFDGRTDDIIWKFEDGKTVKISSLGTSQGVTYSLESDKLKLKWSGLEFEFDRQSADKATKPTSTTSLSS